MKIKKVLGLVLVLLLSLGTLAACGNSSELSEDKQGGSSEKTEGNNRENNKETSGGNGEVYFLNGKPEISDELQEIADIYESETGTKVNVVTAAANTYESTLKSEMAKSSAPTLFQFNGMVGYEAWKDYTANLADTNFYTYLEDKSLAISTDDGVWGIPAAIEGYGIIYNKAILNAYCALDGAVIASADEVNNFETLKAVAEGLQENKDELGIAGAFAATSFSSGEDWRWQTHLFNLPLYYEYQARGIDDADTLEGTYVDQYKAIFDLYLENSSTASGLLSSKTVEDSMAEFALGQVAFVQNGDWAWSSIEGYEVEAEDIGYLPIYIGAEGEENQGLCIGTETFWAVNSQASSEDQEATLAFIDWLFNSETGKDLVINKLGFTVPFNTFDENETPSNPLAKAIVEYTTSGKTSVSWAFNSMPSQKYKNDLGAALLEYAQGTSDWENVEKVIIDNWAAEKASPTEE